MVDLRIDPEQEQDARLVSLIDHDTGEHRWFDFKVLARFLKARMSEEEIWEAGATDHDMFELNQALGAKKEEGNEG